MIISDFSTALKLSKEQKKKILIYRYKKTDLIRSTERGFEISDKFIEESFNKKNIKSYLKYKFIIFRYDYDDPSNKGEIFSKTFRYNIVPNFIIIDWDLIPLANIPLISFKKDSNLINTINYNIEISKNASEELRALTIKYSNKTISNSNLYKLILLRDKFGLKNKEQITLYCDLKGNLTDELYFVGEAQGFSTSDKFTEYLLNYEDNEILILKKQYLNLIIENARRNLNEIELNNAKSLLNKLDNTDPLSNINYRSDFPKEDFFYSINFDNKVKELKADFNYYVKLKDRAKIAKYGELLANEIINNIIPNRYKIIRSQETMTNWVMRQPEKSTKFKEKDIIYKKNLKNFNKEFSDILNNIGWQFYLNLKDRNYLLKSINWMNEAIKLRKNSFLLDTYSHLNYILGNIDKAIKFQKEAIKIAIKNQISSEQILKNKKELEKFEIKNE